MSCLKVFSCCLTGWPPNQNAASSWSNFAVGGRLLAHLAPADSSILVCSPSLSQTHLDCSQPQPMKASDMTRKQQANQSWTGDKHGAGYESLVDMSPEALPPRELHIQIA